MQALWAQTLHIVRFGVVEVNGVCVPGGVGGNVSLVGVLGGGRGGGGGGERQKRGAKRAIESSVWF